MSEPTPKPELKTPREGEPITRNEIMDVLADEGYSAGSRKTWLKGVLTRLVSEERKKPDRDRKHLIAEIKTILRQQIPGDPEAEDTL